ncbi:MAG: helix-turn-helix transcriptional regulator [Caldilineaceae bacterium]|nr:helix-turn-helix transcriptional regulator [Caldilineaceae bacterium]
MTRGAVLQEIWDQLPDERKHRILAQADVLRAEYLTLQELRREAGLTQVQVSQALNIPQSNVSRLESSSDMLLSSLRGYVEAVGGKLSLVVELPDKQPIVLGGFGDLLGNGDDSQSRGKVEPSTVPALHEA